MSYSAQETRLPTLAAGFTLGFGVLTVWKAIKQTRSVKVPRRSAYLYMVWGEIFSNLFLGVMGWLLLEGVLPEGYVHGIALELFIKSLSLLKFLGKFIPYCSL
jgi:hypothetical protein